MSFRGFHRKTPKADRAAGKRSARINPYKPKRLPTGDEKSQQNNAGATGSIK